ncbi:MAG: ribosomal-processing cysteine protease Prp [Lachnospiraceae bacterium]|nr:ribosomal-processing cysteine protease Prp [Lachnospiraceae bacterium]
MTIISILKDKNVTIKIKGHAGYMAGNDIVCSALSISEHMLTEWVYNHKEAAEFIEVKRLSGDVTLKIRAISESFYTALEVIETGFRALAREYPLNVCLFISDN